MTERLRLIVLTLATVHTASCFIYGYMPSICPTPSTSTTPTTARRLSCRYCQDADSLDDCTQICCPADMESAQQQPFKMCYMEELLTDRLLHTLKFNGGCRLRHGCNAGFPAWGRRDNVLACRRCCDHGHDCNHMLCGIKPLPTAAPAPTSASTAMTSSSHVTPRRHVTCLGCVNSTRDLPGCSIVTCDAETQTCYVDVVDGMVNAGCRAKQLCQAATVPGKRHQHALSGSARVTSGSTRTTSGSARAPSTSARATSGCSTCCDASQQCLCNGLHCGLNNYAVLNLMNKANCFSG